MKNKKLNISTANKNYPIVIGSNIFTNFYKNISSYIKNNKVFIITDKNINGLYQKDLKKIKKNKNLDLEIIVIGIGEKQKNIRNISSICDILLKKIFQEMTLLLHSVEGLSEILLVLWLVLF